MFQQKKTFFTNSLKDIKRGYGKKQVASIHDVKQNLNSSYMDYNL